MDKNKKILIGVGSIVIILGILALVFSNNKNSSIESNSEQNSSSNMSPVTAESPTFENTIWSANSIESKDLIVGSTITIQFDDTGRIAGTDGCNTFSSTYELNGAEITINPNMISTKKACDENVMTQADSFTKFLLASTNYKLGDGAMILLQGENEGLKFLGSTNALTKTSWNVTGYNNGNEAVVGPIVDANPTITFGDDGTISGSAGCNTFSGTYSINGESIEISTIASTQRECIEPDGIMEQESSFLSYLQQSETWLIQGDTLYLRTSEDQLAITAVSSSTPN